MGLKELRARQGGAGPAGSASILFGTASGFTHTATLTFISPLAILASGEIPLCCSGGGEFGVQRRPPTPVGTRRSILACTKEALPAAACAPRREGGPASAGRVGWARTDARPSWLALQGEALVFCLNVEMVYVLRHTSMRCASHPAWHGSRPLAVP